MHAMGLRCTIDVCGYNGLCLIHGYNAWTSNVLTVKLVWSPPTLVYQASFGQFVGMNLAYRPVLLLSEYH